MRAIFLNRYSVINEYRGASLGQLDQSCFLPGALTALRWLRLAGFQVFVVSHQPQISRGQFQVNPGSLFPAFRRLERDGLISAEWRPTENNRRAKYYALTPAGRARLRRDTRDWEAQTAAITRILRARPETL